LRTLSEVLAEYGPVFVVARGKSAIEISRRARRDRVAVITALDSEEVTRGLKVVISEECSEPYLVAMSLAVATIYGRPVDVVISVDPGETTHGLALMVAGVLVATETRRDLEGIVTLVTELTKYLQPQRLIVKVGVSPASARHALRLAKALLSACPSVTVYLVEEDRAGRVVLGSLLEKCRIKGRHEVSALKILLTPLRHCMKLGGR